MKIKHNLITCLEKDDMRSDSQSESPTNFEDEASNKDEALQMSKTSEF